MAALPLLMTDTNPVAISMVSLNSDTSRLTLLFMNGSYPRMTSTDHGRMQQTCAPTEIRHPIAFIPRSTSVPFAGDRRRGIVGITRAMAQITVPAMNTR